MEIIPPNKYEYHRFCLLFPIMQKADMDELLSDMQKHGLRHEITLFQEQILDGRNRYIACQRLGIEPRFTYFHGTEREALDFVMAENLARRHLEVDIRILIAAEISKIRFGMNQYTLEGSEISVDTASELMQVGARSVHRAKAILEKGSPELVEAYRNQEISTRAASELLNAPLEIQREAIASTNPGKVAQDFVRQEQRKQMKEELGRSVPEEQFQQLCEAWRTSWEFTYQWNAVDKEIQKRFIKEILGYEL